MAPRVQAEDDFSLRMLLGVLRRRWLVLAACLSLGVALSLAISLLQDDRYTASASLLFRDPGFDQKLFGSTFLDSSQDPDREAATNVRLVSLDVVAARTAKKLGGAVTGGDVADIVEVAPEGQSDVVSVSATHTDPKFAARVANAFATEYIAFRRDADRSKVQEAQTLVERQLDALPPEQRAGIEARSLRDRSEQLEILASLQTGNAELVQRARVPEARSSPRLSRNLVIGILLGGLGGILLALMIERLDRRVRDPAEIEVAFDRARLGTIPNSSSLTEDGLPTPAPLPPQESEAFRTLRTNLRYFNVDRGLKSVLITSAVPGEGKSTVAWNLATAAAKVGERVLLIEADLRRPSFAHKPGVYPTPGLSTALAGQATLEEVTQTVTLDTEPEDRSFGVVTAGPLPPNPGELLESKRVRALIESAVDAYDLVIVDTPPTSVVSDAIPLMSVVDGVIVVARLGRTTREAMFQLRNHLSNLAAPLLGVVINGAAREGSAYGYRGYYANGSAAESGRGGGATSRRDREKSLRS